MDVDIRDMRPSDWPRVERIYAAGIATGNATFEVAAPTWDHFDRSRLPAHRFVATAVGHEATERDPTLYGTAGETTVLGWIAASAVSTRPAYSGVVEHSVYVDPEYAGRGIGRTLLDLFIRSTEESGIWTIQSSIFPENVASLALHARAGFRTVGVRERIGRHHGIWRDTILIERRSPRT